MFSNLEWKYIFREEVTVVQVQTSETKINESADEDPHPHDSIKTGCRTQFTGPQLGDLERAFKENRYPDLETR